MMPGPGKAMNGIRRIDMTNKIFSMHEMMEVVIHILDTRDPYTFEHSWRVSALSERIAECLDISQEWKETVHLAAHLHDMGKIGVPDYILNKPGSLTAAEFELIKAHSDIGFQIVRKIPSLEKIALYVRHHHERWDGKGYPSGLMGKNIPFGARIIAVADTYDALTSRRPYRDGISHDEAVRIISHESEKQFCPEAVEAFLSIKHDILPAIELVNGEIREKNALRSCARVFS